MNIPLNIDWQQILLHLLNFVILAGGLYLLLYKPVLAFMEKRQSYYREQDRRAAETLADAEKKAAEVRRQMQDADGAAAFLQALYAALTDCADLRALLSCSQELYFALAHRAEALPEHTAWNTPDDRAQWRSAACIGRWLTEKTRKCAN